VNQASNDHQSPLTGGALPHREAPHTHSSSRKSGASSAKIDPGDGQRPEVQVKAKKKRRRFTAAQKLALLKQADACTKPGELGAFLRREGLYSSHLADWRRARERGELQALEPRKRGRKAKEVDPRDKRIAELERELTKERARRERAEALVEVQKKVALLLGQPTEDETR
jgi:transposase